MQGDLRESFWPQIQFDAVSSFLIFPTLYWLPLVGTVWAVEEGEVYVSFN